MVDRTSRALLGSVLAVLAFSLAACASGGGAPEPATPAAGASSGPATSAPTATAAAAGPLASLDAKDAKPETWQLESGPAPFLSWDALHLRVSASCRQPGGQMDCDALRAARSGQTVELTPQDRARPAPPGAAVCVKLRVQLGTHLASGRDASGNEDGFCVFKDGSMISTGSLASYVLKQ